MIVQALDSDEVDPRNGKKMEVVSLAISWIHLNHSFLVRSPPRGAGGPFQDEYQSALQLFRLMSTRRAGAISVSRRVPTGEFRQGSVETPNSRRSALGDNNCFCGIFCPAEGAPEVRSHQRGVGTRERDTDENGFQVLIFRAVLYIGSYC